MKIASLIEKLLQQADLTSKYDLGSIAAYYAKKRSNRNNENILISEQALINQRCPK
ncbi:hypothetical protein OLMES_3888 [Oleiphilus messinensis]|uniref:Uncharacterized protein n=1 Tax=Oleiphilus messinensis TaxID=141451 RepID=A0A1Y0IBL7_9GAMM|nr:hypothetical protein OLMES_3888 [Oleiphilus messinensis]